MNSLDLLDDLEQSQEETAVELESLDLNSDYNEFVQENVSYPALLLCGLGSEEEFKFFRNRTHQNEEYSLPLFCTIEGVIVQIGRLELTMDSLLLVRSIADYKLFLMKDKNEQVEIHLDEPDYLSKFIKL